MVFFSRRELTTFRLWKLTHCTSRKEVSENRRKKGHIKLIQQWTEFAVLCYDFKSSYQHNTFLQINMESGSTAVIAPVGPSSPIASSGPPLPPPSVRSLTSTPAMSPGPGPIAMPGPIGSTTTGMMMPLKLDKPVYSSPPPAPSNPENNQCKMIDYRGAKIAAFNVDGRELVCLPQAFELFLKHLVGGLHTVYTKLKRLDIVPIVCNVEQVRVLRGLGAIQPGVNRCKLISPKEFDILYDDCTNSR